MLLKGSPTLRKVRLAPAAGFLSAAISLVLIAGCGSSSPSNSGKSSAKEGSTAAASASITPPASIKSAGQISYCSEIDFPPLESYEGQTPIGADIEIGEEIAAMMGVEASWENTGFEALIASLEANKCDAIISGMNDTAERRKQIFFVEYLKIGQSLIVPAGNPKNISGLESLSGKNVATVVGTTQAEFLKEENAKLKAAGKAPITVTLFSQNTAALSALLTNRVDVDFDSATFAATAVKSQPQLEIAGTPVNPIPDGIGIRKQNTELQQAMQKAVDQLYENGTMKRILAKWDLSESALK